MLQINIRQGNFKVFVIRSALPSDLTPTLIYTYRYAVPLMLPTRQEAHRVLLFAVQRFRGLSSLSASLFPTTPLSPGTQAEIKFGCK